LCGIEALEFARGSLAWQDDQAPIRPWLLVELGGKVR
jgi:hypothetical protein